MISAFKSSNFFHILKSCSDPDGRTSRLELVQYYIHAIFVVIVLSCLNRIFSLSQNLAVFEDFFPAGIVLFIVMAAIFSFVIKIRRLHDLNLTGWWLLFSFVPICSLALLFGLLCGKGHKNANRFGEPTQRIVFNKFDKLFWLISLISIGIIYFWPLSS